MHNRFVRKQNQRDRNADPVIGAKTGTICGNKLAIIYDLDRVLHRIEGYALCGHADHVHMGLQDHPWCFFISRSSGFLNDHIAYPVHRIT